MSQTDKRAVNTVHALLMDRLPLTFPKDYDAIRPVKVGILADLRQRLPDVDPVLLRRALANHTRRDGYLLALIHGRGDRRYDLDGQPVGTVTPEERAAAQQRLAAAQQRLAASTTRGQAKAERVRVHQEREAKRRQQREIERRNREAKAARKAEHARIQQEIAARKAALLAQGIVPESRAERKRRLARAATGAHRTGTGPAAAASGVQEEAPDRPARRERTGLTRKPVHVTRSWGWREIPAGVISRSGCDFSRKALRL